MERDAAKNWKNSICEYYLKGSCHHKQSKDCSFAHGDQDLQWYKTSLCQHHKTGNCVYGKKCKHAHGKIDLRRDCKFHFEFKHGCKQGSACAFSHQEKDSKQYEYNASPGGSDRGDDQVLIQVKRLCGHL